MTTQAKRETWTDGAYNFIQKLGAVVASIAILTSFFYLTFVKAPLDELNARINKIEIQYHENNKTMEQMKQSILIIEERSKYTAEDIKFIKRKFEKE